MPKCSKCNEDRPVNEFYIQDKKTGRLNPWCKPCYREWHRQRYQVETNDDPRACATCGEVYAPKVRRRSMYCSKLCKDKAKNARVSVELHAAKPARRCCWCGDDMPQSMRSDAAFCSARCNELAHRRTKNWRRRRGDLAAKRPRKNPLPSFVDIAERDGWQCQLCGESVDRDLDHPNPLAGSIDHKVPVARGGGDEFDNLQLAHFRCNWSRQDKEPQCAPKTLQAM